jgi:hypothetical protein
MPTEEICTAHDMFCFAALANLHMGAMYTDLTSAFPVRSFKNMQYIFVAYIYDLNPILVHEMPSKNNAAMIAAFSDIFSTLAAHGYAPTLNVMDNDCSKVVKAHIKANKMNVHLVPPHNHHINAAERAIATFKEHFIAGLATVDKNCPLQLWDEFLPQIELTLNLLCFSRCKPSRSTNKEVNRHFDYNKTPIAPLGSKGIVYKDPAIYTSWAPHGTDAYHISPAPKHYRCLRFYMPATRRCHIADTWRLYPTQCTTPSILQANLMVLQATNVLQSLGTTITTSTTESITNNKAIQQLQEILSPRLHPGAADSRVPIAPEPRVAAPATRVL